MTKVFSKALMASEDVQSYVGSCRFYANDAQAPIYDGAFVNIGGLDLDGVYSATSLDYNIHKAIAPAEGKLTREDICVIDLADINEATVQGNVMRIGGKLVDLQIAAGNNARFRRLMKGDKFWLGAGCFSEVPTVGEFATVEAGELALVPAEEITEDQINFAVLTSKALTVGQSVYATGDNAWEQLFLVEVL